MTRVPLARLRGALRPFTPTKVPGVGAERHAPARHPLRSASTYRPAMRIAYDVSPLSHPRTGVGNYMRGSLARARRGGRAGTRSSRSRRRAARASAAIPEALDGIAGRAAPAVLPLAHAWRTAWSRARPARRPSACSAASTCSTSPTGCTRRSAAASARRRSTTSCRSAFPSGRTADACACTAPSTATPRARATSSSCNSHFTARRRATSCSASPAERMRVAHPGVDAGSRADGRARRPRPPYVLTVATLEPRKNLGTLLDAHALLGDGLALAVVGAAGWGEQPQLDRPGVVRARLRRRRRARAPLPRRRGVRLPVAIRGLRHPDRRGDGERRARRRVVASVARRGLRRRGRARRSRTAPEAFAAASSEALAATATSSCRWASRTRARFTVARDGRRVPRGYREALRDCARERRHRRVAARPDARRDGALRAGPAAAARAAGSSVERLAFGGAGRAARVAARRAAGTSLALPRHARRARRPPLPELPAPLRARVPVVVTVHDLAVLAPPAGFNRWTRSYGRVLRPARVRAPRRA